MKISPYKYSSVSRQNVLQYNALFEKDPGLMFQLGEDIYALRFEPDGGTPPIFTPLEAHVQINDRITFKFCPEEQLLNLMLGDVATSEDLKTLSEELRGVALEAAFERILDHVDQLGENRSTIHRICAHPEGEHTDVEIHFSMTREKDGARCMGYLRTDDDGLQWIAKAMGGLSAKTHHDLDQLRVAGGIEIGSCRLTTREVDRLDPNDILLAETTGDPEEREIRIRFSSGLALEGNLVESGRLLIQNIITENEESVSMEQTDHFTVETADTPVEDIPVRLVFEIGRMDMPIGTLKHLQPGYTVPLDASIDRHKPVTIKANGTPVGRGEIVMIDDYLGIRILEFNTPTGSL